MERFPRERRYLLPALHYIHDEFDYLSEHALQTAAWHLRVPASEVYGAATSYTELRVEAPAEHTVRICTGLSCLLNGAAISLELRRARPRPGSTRRRSRSGRAPFSAPPPLW